MFGKSAATSCCGVCAPQQHTAAEVPLLTGAKCCGMRSTSAPQLYTAVGLRPPQQYTAAEKKPHS
eukprot:8298627-Lingulodinium_polyedra.AAC.1